MSVRLRSDKIFDKRVIILLITECQKNKTLFICEDLNLDPYTTSASYFSKGKSNLLYSSGLYSRSASWIIIISPVAFSKPLLIAFPFPLLNSILINLLYRLLLLSKYSKVLSFEPSLITIISKFFESFSSTFLIFSKLLI